MLSGLRRLVGRAEADDLVARADADGDAYQGSVLLCRALDEELLSLEQAAELVEVASQAVTETIVDVGQPDTIEIEATTRLEGHLPARLDPELTAIEFEAPEVTKGDTTFYEGSDGDGGETIDVAADEGTQFDDETGADEGTQFDDETGADEATQFDDGTGVAEPEPGPGETIEDESGSSDDGDSGPDPGETPDEGSARPTAETLWQQGETLAAADHRGSGSSSGDGDGDKTGGHSSQTIAPERSQRASARSSGAIKLPLGLARRRSRADKRLDVLPLSLPAAAPQERYEGHPPSEEAESWLARDRRLLRATVVRQPGPGQRDEIFIREARVLARLDHPAIPKVHDVGTMGGRAYFAVDDSSGSSLSEALAGRRPAVYQQPRFLRAVLEAAAAIEHAHDRGLAHGDLSPQSLILGKHGRVTIGGWERAQLLETADEDAREVLGPGPDLTEARGKHQAPELAAEEPADRRTDVWGLGLILGYALLGRQPLGPDAFANRPDVAPELAAIVNKATSPAPGDRYQRAGALAAEIRRYLDGRRVDALPDTPLRAVRRVARAYPLPSALVAGALVLSLAGASWTTWRVSSSYRAATAARISAEQALETALAERQDSRLKLDRIQAAEELLTEREAIERALIQAVVPNDFERAELRLAALGDYLDANRQALEGLLPPPEEFLGPVWRTFRHERGRRALASGDSSRAAQDLRELVRLLLQVPPAERDEQHARRLGQARLELSIALSRLPGQRAYAERREVLLALAKSRLDQGQDAASYVRIAQLTLDFDNYDAELRSAHLSARPTSPTDERLPALQVAARAALEERPDLQLCHMLMIQVKLATHTPNILRGAVVRNRDINSVRKSLALANALDPADPIAALLAEAVLNSTRGLHSLQRYEGAWQIDRVWRTAKRSRQPEIKFRGALALARVRRWGAVHELLDEARRELSVLARAGDSPRLAWLPNQIELLRSRARLHGGAELDMELADLDVTPAEVPLRDELRGWQELVDGGDWQAVQRLLAGGRKSVSLQVAAMVDPRVDTQVLIPELLSIFRKAPEQAWRGGRGALGPRLLVPLMVLTGREGKLPPRDLFERIPAMLRPRPRRNKPPAPPIFTEEERSLVNAGQALFFLRSGRDDLGPLGHSQALETWATINLDTASAERAALWCQEGIVQRLREQEQEELARAFAELDPLQELIVPPSWLAPGAARWSVPK